MTLVRNNTGDLSKSDAAKLPLVAKVLIAALSGFILAAVMAHALEVLHH